MSINFVFYEFVWWVPHRHNRISSSLKYYRYIVCILNCLFLLQSAYLFKNQVLHISSPTYWLMGCQEVTLFCVLGREIPRGETLSTKWCCKKICFYYFADFFDQYYFITAWWCVYRSCCSQILSSTLNF